MAWVVTWVVFLTALGIGSASLSSYGSVPRANEVLSYLIPSLGIALLIPGAASIIIGFFSSIRWGEEFRNIIASQERLALAWLPGVRLAKRSWNLSRSFLWVSWISGPAGIVGYYSAIDLWGPVGTNLDAGLILLSPFILFVFCRIAHHFLFAQSITGATRALIDDGSRAPSGLPKDWWQLSAIPLPFDPIIIFLLAILSGGILGASYSQSDASLSLIVTLVVTAGLLSMAAAAVLSLGYWSVEKASRSWLSRTSGSEPGRPDSLPPEWLSA